MQNSKNARYFLSAYIEAEFNYRKYGNFEVYKMQTIRKTWWVGAITEMISKQKKLNSYKIRGLLVREARVIS